MLAEEHVSLLLKKWHSLNGITYYSERARSLFKLDIFQRIDTFKIADAVEFWRPAVDDEEHWAAAFHFRIVEIADLFELLHRTSHHVVLRGGFRAQI